MGAPVDRETNAEQGMYLESWKAIAAYLDRDVTTAQRWERSEGLPVHRLVHSKGGSVYAYSIEIDEWRKRRSRVPAGIARNDAAAVTPAGHTRSWDERRPSAEAEGVLANPPTAAHADAPAAVLPWPVASSVAAAAEPAGSSVLPVNPVLAKLRSRPPLWLGLAAALGLVMGGTAAWLYGDRALSSASAGHVVGQGLPPAAHEEYLKGRHRLTENRLQSIQESIQYFQAALKIAPLYAPAYAGLASAHTDLATVGFGLMPPEQALPRALAAAREAVRLDPTLAEGYSVLGRALVVQYSWAEAGEAYAKALRLNPGDARTHMWYAEWLLSQHRTSEAIEHAERGAALEPLSMRIAGELGLVLYLAHRYEDAVRRTSEVLAVEPTHRMALWMRANARVQLGQHADAVADLERAVAAHGRSAALVGSMAAAYASAGRREVALQLVDELESRKRREYVPATSLAPAYAALGHVDKVVSCIEETIRQKGNGVHLLPANPAYKDIRSDPGFVAALQKVGLTP